MIGTLRVVKYVFPIVFINTILIYNRMLRLE